MKILEKVGISYSVVVELLITLIISLGSLILNN